MTSSNLLDPSIFSYLEAKIEEESRVRDALSQIVQRLERAVATTQGLLSRVHSTPRSGYPALVNLVEDAIKAQVVIIKDLNALASQHPYYKYNHKWTRAVQSSIFTTLYCAWLGVGLLLQTPTTTDLKATTTTTTDPNPAAADDVFHLTTEEYLLALTDLTNDLARLATNAVTLGDFRLPLLISAFVKDLLAGFQLLNLKNDVLRKRADAVKYDVKRVEDVVYDLSLRGLVARDAPDAEMSSG
ncbi:Translin [Escovopsis weberi]|uniref:Translin n=1 Tax=Escovopsis weberi TaxID=150374 RepID=A0A0M9VXD0_ESCWE|nr:Translin [Escovopsis weberi]